MFQEETRLFYFVPMKKCVEISKVYERVCIQNKGVDGCAFQRIDIIFRRKSSPESAKCNMISFYPAGKSTVPDHV